MKPPLNPSENKTGSVEAMKIHRRKGKSEMARQLERLSAVGSTMSEHPSGLEDLPREFLIQPKIGSQRKDAKKQRRSAASRSQTAKQPRIQIQTQAPRTL